MANYQYMITADDIKKELHCSKSYAYKVIRMLSEELAREGYITISGRIPRAYYAKKVYGYTKENWTEVFEDFEEKCTTVGYKKAYKIILDKRILQ